MNVEVRREKSVCVQRVNVGKVKENVKLKTETIATETLHVVHHHVEERIAAEVVSNVPMPEVASFIEGEGWSCKSYTDIDDSKDPQMCSTYAADIYFHLRTAEVSVDLILLRSSKSVKSMVSNVYQSLPNFQLKRRPATNFMETLQQDINTSMRSILMDWLVEVTKPFYTKLFCFDLVVVSFFYMFILFSGG